MPNETNAWEIQTGWPIATTWRLGAVQPDGTTITVDALGVIRALGGGGSGGGLAVPSGQSGGIPYYSASGTIGASTPLAADAIVLGGGPGVAPFSLSGTGIAGQVLTSAGPGGPPVWQSISGTGSVTSISTANGITGGPITSSGTISLASIAAGQLLANTTGGTASPIGVSLTALLDANFGTAQGGIAYRGASAWSFLAPGTSGQFLQTQGAGANPTWAAGAGGGSGPVTLTGDISGSGTGTITTTLPTINSTVGTYPKVTINAKGQVTNGSALVSTDLPTNAVMPGTGAITVPVGTTGQQPGTPTNGMQRFNSTTSRYEWYIGAAWINHVRLTGETGVVDLTTATSVSVPTPTASGHAVTKAYADALLATPVSAVANAFLGWDNTSTPVAKTLRRVVSGTTDAPTAADHQSTIEYTSSSAVTVTINNLGAGITFVVRRTGSGTVTLAAGSGVTLTTTSDNTSPSYAVLQHGTLVVYCEATAGSVAVDGKMV